MASETLQEAIALLEDLIVRQVQKLWTCGRLLARIRDEELYKELGYVTFSRYCLGRIGLSRSQIYRLIDADRVMRSLEELPEEPKPTNERHLRPLARLTLPEDIRRAWLKAIELAAGGAVTHKHVLLAVSQQTLADFPPGATPVGLSASPGTGISVAFSSECPPLAQPPVPHGGQAGSKVNMDDEGSTEPRDYKKYADDITPPVITQPPRPEAVRCAPPPGGSRKRLYTPVAAREDKIGYWKALYLDTLAECHRLRDTIEPLKARIEQLKNSFGSFLRDGTVPQSNRMRGRSTLAIF